MSPYGPRPADDGWAEYFQRDNLGDTQPCAEEVARMLEAAPGIKYKAALSVAYGEARMFNAPFLVVTVGAALAISSPLLAGERNGGNDSSASTNSTSNASAMLAPSQLGNATSISRAGLNKHKRKGAMTQRSRCNNEVCKIPSPGGPGPIPYPNIAATSR
jgi:hypothetical protein